jgi:hypothetical protein
LATRVAGAGCLVDEVAGEEDAGGGRQNVEVQLSQTYTGPTQRAHMEPLLQRFMEPGTTVFKAEKVAHGEPIGWSLIKVDDWVDLIPRLEARRYFTGLAHAPTSPPSLNFQLNCEAKAVRKRNPDA